MIYFEYMAIKVVKCQGKRQFEVWRSHFAKVLGGNDEGNREASCTQVNY